MPKRFDPSTFSLQLFDYTGNWTVQDTNCTDYEGCFPIVSAMRDTEVNGRYKVQLIYPNDLECGI